MLAGFVPVAKAIADLLHPHAEVVIHDIKRNKIAALFNNFSKRKVGGDSLLEEGLDFDKRADVLGPYEKINWNGNRLKSISAVIRDSAGKIIGLLCINLDISKLEDWQRILNNFINGANFTAQPKSLFKDDWQEKINNYVHTYLRQQQLSLDNLTAETREEIIKILYKEGAFNGKNAANYVAQVLGISRATVYKSIAKITATAKSKKGLK